MSVNKSLQAVLAPQVTEKATMVADKHNQFAFKVKKDATKKEVKEAKVAVKKAAKEVKDVAKAAAGKRTSKKRGRKPSKK